MQQPLIIYILWHPDFDDGEKYAKDIYSTFSRDVNEPLSRGIGMPVYFGASIAGKTTPRPIDFTLSKRTAIIALVDDKMVIDKEWNTYINEIIKKTNSQHILYPVAFTKNSFKLSGEIPDINFIRLFNIKGETQKTRELLSILSQELCRLVYDRKRLSEAESEMEISPAPVKLFISHAKRDGEKLALVLKKYIDGQTLIHSFFDTKDIARGFKFAKEIEANIKQSILLVVQTDSYSAREWCKKEVLEAKKYNCPVMIISALTKGEERSFPYMANVPTINWNIKGLKKQVLMEEIILKAMLEALRFRFHKENIKYLISTFDVNLEDRNILETPPELLSFIKIKSLDKKIVVYPDPPLGDEELEILDEFESGVRFVTPTVIPTLEASSTRFLSDIKIGISISESQDISMHGLGRMHLQDAMVEFARYLLVCGAVLMYGGDVRYRKDFNFATILFELVQTHNSERKEPAERIKNFISFPIYTKIDNSERAKLTDAAELIEISPPDDLEVKEKANVFFKSKSARINYTWARCLSRMREEMNQNIHARIILGGKTGDFKGKYPGLLEEAYLALKFNKPVYLIGAFGGCARAIIKGIEGETPEEFTQNHQFSNPAYRDFTRYYNEEAKKIGALEPIDYEKLLEFLHKKGIDGLNNGLSLEENKRLFTTRSIPEMISLVLKGLKEIKPGV